MACSKIGLSTTLARTYRPMPSNTIENRNGIRQPHARNCSLGISAASARAAVPRKAPDGPPALVKDAARPRLRVSACSSDMSAAPPHSPPIAMPWTARRMTSMSAPHTGTGGTRPMRNDAMPMMNMVSMSIFLRPMRSPVVPEDDAAERPGDVRGGERQQRRHGRRVRVQGREEHRAEDDGGGGRVENEVIELDRAPEKAGQDDTAPLARAE